MFPRNQNCRINDDIMVDLNVNDIQNLPDQRALQNNLENAQEETQENSTSFEDEEDPHTCVICFQTQLAEYDFDKLQRCGHSFCKECLKTYLTMQINESRANLTCPRCPWPMHLNDIQRILRDTPHLIQKYEEFMLRCYLVALPDTCWCPAPECSYAVIASECGLCPKLICQRPGCGMEFCFFCRKPWSTHEDGTCPYSKVVDNKPEIEVQENVEPSDATTGNIEASIENLEVKECTVCETSVVNELAGSCNHMFCNTDFCWLCLQPINGLHFSEPASCDVYGKKTVSQKRRSLWQRKTCVKVPLRIETGALMTVPAAPATHLCIRYRYANRYKRILMTTVGTVVHEPIVAMVTIEMGYPGGIVYPYGVLPLSMTVEYPEQQRSIRNGTKRFNYRQAAIAYQPQSDENDDGSYESISAVENDADNNKDIDNDDDDANAGLTTIA